MRWIDSTRCGCLRASIDEGSFAGAARALNLSAAVVTRLVADLEEHLGARLINRTTRRLALTDTGELYLERVRHILTEVEEAEALATASTAEPRGHVRVLSPPAFAVHQLAKHLPKFRALYPRVTLELSVPGAVETVDENFDVSIVTEGRRPLDGSFVARRLARSEVILCASPEYLDRRGRPQHPNELLQHEAMVPNFLRELALHDGRGDDEPSAIADAAGAAGAEHRPHRHAVRRRAGRPRHHRAAVVRRRRRAARERARARAAALASDDDDDLRRHADAQARAGAHPRLRRLPGADLRRRGPRSVAARGGCETPARRLRRREPAPRRTMRRRVAAFS